MDPITVTQAIKKHGVVAVLTVFLFFTFNFFSDRLDQVEQKLERVENQLYDCLEDKASEKIVFNPFTDKNIKYPVQSFAILPDRLKIKWKA